MPTQQQKDSAGSLELLKRRLSELCKVAVVKLKTEPSKIELLAWRRQHNPVKNTTK